MAESTLYYMADEKPVSAANPKALLKAVILENGVDMACAAKKLNVDEATISAWSSGLATKGLIERSFEGGVTFLKPTKRILDAINAEKQKNEKQKPGKSFSFESGPQRILTPKQQKRLIESLKAKLIEKDAILQGMKDELLADKKRISELEQRIERIIREDGRELAERVSECEKRYEREHQERLKLQRLVESADRVCSVKSETPCQQEISTGDDECEIDHALDGMIDDEARFIKEDMLGDGGAIESNCSDYLGGGNRVPAPVPETGGNQAQNPDSSDEGVQNGRKDDNLQGQNKGFSHEKGGVICGDLRQTHGIVGVKDDECGEKALGFDGENRDSSCEGALRLLCVLRDRSPVKMSEAAKILETDVKSVKGMMVGLLKDDVIKVKKGFFSEPKIFLGKGADVEAQIQKYRALSIRWELKMMREGK